jgi:hypothetical protein
MVPDLLLAFERTFNESTQTPMNNQKFHDVCKTV